jgi:hypothetical protein
VDAADSNEHPELMLRENADSTLEKSLIIGWETRHASPNIKTVNIVFEKHAALWHVTIVVNDASEGFARSTH